MPNENTSPSNGGNNETPKVSTFGYFTDMISNGSDVDETLNQANKANSNKEAEFVLRDRETEWEENKAKFNYDDSNPESEENLKISISSTISIEFDFKKKEKDKDQEALNGFRGDLWK